MLAGPAPASKMAAPRTLAAARRAAAAPRGWRGAGGGTGPGRSRLYEHVREGLSARPQLEVSALSEQELERRRGPLRGGDLREIVSGAGRGRAGLGRWERGGA